MKTEFAHLKWPNRTLTMAKLSLKKGFHCFHKCGNQTNNYPVVNSRNLFLFAYSQRWKSDLRWSKTHGVYSVCLCLWNVNKQQNLQNGKCTLFSVSIRRSPPGFRSIWCGMAKKIHLFFLSLNFMILPKHLKLCTSSSWVTSIYL